MSKFVKCTPGNKLCDAYSDPPPKKVKTRKKRVKKGK